MSGLCTGRNQRGISLISVLVIGIFLVFVLILVFRSVPVINEYLSIKRAMYAVSTSVDLATPDYEIRDAFDRRAIVDGISSVKSNEVKISRPNNRVVLAVAYDRKVPLFANVSLLYEFNTSTQDVK